MTDRMPAEKVAERALRSELARDMTIEGLRTAFELLTHWLNKPLPRVGAFHPRVPIYADREDVTVDVIVPSAPPPFPVLLYIHGGAWVAGSPATHRRLTFRFAEAGYLVVSVDYRLAPEHPFPAAFLDCEQALHWTARLARSFGGDASRLAIGGDSAGANLAAAVAIASKARLMAPRIRAALLIYGVFDFAAVGGKRFAPIMHHAYLGRDAARHLLLDARVSPIHGARDLPPCYIVVGDEDPLLADSEMLHATLTEARIEHQYDVIPGMPHGFVQMEHFGEARRTIDRMLTFLAPHTRSSMLARVRHHTSRMLASFDRRRLLATP